MSDNCAAYYCRSRLTPLRFAYAIVDGHLQKVSNFTVEIPGLFRGRGKHPKTGTLKERVQPEAITINCSSNAPVPRCPIPGHVWGSVRIMVLGAA